ncbi:SEC-C metal-binding domain-containing protein [Flavobacterium sp. LC2016-13]|uniref:SEC-C metal-binding domain-containing protein n=2 Tax=unclassified Flavobacterium TaxID=196869 RepID=UPI0012B83F72|nr:SEC-C metal-binding domain-containing protein [Flavobacterium sp. LC2016-13]MTD71557.1 zinc chelation protein SecC [Flavobacterium sp. LC2016-13]
MKNPKKKLRMMKNQQVWNKIEELGEPDFPYEDVIVKLQNLKELAVKKDAQEQAKEVWICQTIIGVHKLYSDAFKLLKDKQYYQAWCQLERTEKTMSSLKRHFPFKENKYFLNFIERSVRNLQVIFPYRFFASMEIVKTSVLCSVCSKKVSIRNSCVHIVGEIYDGEMCYRIVDKSEVLGISLVDDPGNKYSVMFITDSSTGEQVDHYSYDIIDYLFDHLSSPYEFWDLRVLQKEIRQEDFKDVNQDDRCTCNSGLKFKECCQTKIGEKYPHYEFSVKNPGLQKSFRTNTTKRAIR